ncbi:MAG: response regulator [Candidatus Eisenbacteria bacterium]|nr:response regulator [Candidatus Latescibacterota bacterium]MBD3301633.1 response regulator [Candidatus Eisenbacteria bacterium]
MRMPATILIVDDQESLRHFLGKALEGDGYAVRTAGTVENGWERFTNEGADLVLLDLRLPDGLGLQLLERLREREPDLPIVMMTAYGEVETAVAAMKSGAYDFLTKPVNLEQLRVILQKALDSTRALRELTHRRDREKERYEKEFVRGRSPAVAAVYEIAEKVAASDTTSVLIQGESGTGKQVIAHYIHDIGPLAGGPFLEINCAAIPRELLESELFGHEKGAFTDARARKQGLLELADGGSLFLDEIGEMSMNLQVKLLKVLETMTFRRVGGTRDISVAVRIISATNQDLGRMVKEGTFREDLYYRLMVVPIRMPPLRERREDIPLLASHYVDMFSRAFRKKFGSISPEAMQKLVEYAWPGNIRELRNVFERTILLEDGDRIEANHVNLGVDPAGDGNGAGNDLLDALRRVLVEGVVDPDGIPFEQWIEEVEKGLILRASDAAAWNQTRTAEILQTTRDKLRYRMKQYRLREKMQAGAG